MNFEDLLFVIKTGTAIAGAATGNPLLITSAEAGARLVKIGHDAYASGRARGEWTADQVTHFNDVVLPVITSQPHWKNPA